MSFKFAEHKESDQLSTPSLRSLVSCDHRIRGVLASVATPERIAESKGHWHGTPISPQQADREVKRLEMARKDIMKGLSKEEKAEYKVHLKDSGPKTMTAEEQAEVVRQMNLNKDKPSH